MYIIVGLIISPITGYYESHKRNNPHHQTFGDLLLYVGLWPLAIGFLISKVCKMTVFAPEPDKEPDPCPVAPKQPNLNRLDSIIY
jgi:hypothetical protein